MKKAFLSILILLGLTQTYACDICGSGAGNSYIGILPDFKKHIVGLRYRYNSLLTHVGASGTNTYLTTKEHYSTLEAWTGWNLGRKFRLMAAVPYSINEKVNQGIRNQKTGIGDVTLSGYYQLLNEEHTVGSDLLTQSLWLGGGVKLATGKYNPEDKAATSNNANLFQLGTGSTDFTLGLMYDIRWANAGVNLSSNYKMNTANRYDYQYGNKFSLNAQAYYRLSIKSVTLSPNAGLQHEQSATDRDKEFSVVASGGTVLLGTAGLEASIGKFAIGANAQTPLSQNLASGIVNANNRMMMHVAIAF